MSFENCSRPRISEGSSNRSFGLVFVIFFLAFAFLPLLVGASPRYWSLVASGLLLLLSMLKPSLLVWPNRAWTLLGALLHKVVNPIVLSIIFFLIITPYALVMRIFRKDQLRLEKDPNADSYWQKRTEYMQNMKRQF